VLYVLFCFGISLCLTFPSDLLLRRVVASLSLHYPSLQVRYTAGDWTWADGWVLRDLTLAGQIAGWPPLRLRRLALQPSLVNLVYHQEPWPLTFNADLYGGQVTGTLTRGGTTIDVQFALRRLTLDQVPFPAPWGQGRVMGQVSTDGTLQGNLADLNSLQGNLTLALADGVLRSGTVAMMPLPALQSAQASVRATLASGRIEVPELIVNADGVEARLQGTISLRTPLAWSALNLQLSTRVVGTPSPALASFISLLPAVPGTQGERRAAITGTFTAPVAR
jgi:type II secretion system protein N